jgi:hypothetical protein
MCLTGILFIDGRIVPHHRWPKATAAVRAR